MNMSPSHKSFHNEELASLKEAPTKFSYWLQQPSSLPQISNVWLYKKKKEKKKAFLYAACFAKEQQNSKARRKIVAEGTEALHHSNTRRLKPFFFLFVRWICSSKTDSLIDRILSATGIRLM